MSYEAGEEHFYTNDGLSWQFYLSVASQWAV